MVKMRIILLALFFLMKMVCFSQIDYEKGYFIRNNGDTINCLIKNSDWKYNPKKINYKLTANSVPAVSDISEMFEFGITGISQYNRFVVDIDTSGQKPAIADLYMSSQSEPEFSTETLFLKLLIDGKAKLYQYEDYRVKRFFLQADTSRLQQLIFKDYYLNGGAVEQNNSFRGQLYNLLRCKEITVADLKNIKYDDADISKIVLKYNLCR